MTGTPVRDDVAVIAVFLAQALAATQVMTGATAALVVAVILPGVVVVAIVMPIVVVAVVVLLVRPGIAVVMVVAMVSALGESTAAGRDAQNEKRGCKQRCFHDRFLSCNDGTALTKPLHRPPVRTGEAVR
jgi:hypothetical protein